jgi:hypothetical protein
MKTETDDHLLSLDISHHSVLNYTNLYMHSTSHNHPADRQSLPKGLMLNWLTSENLIQKWSWSQANASCCQDNQAENMIPPTEDPTSVAFLLFIHTLPII